jgi:hypothetical protein
MFHVYYKKSLSAWCNKNDPGMHHLLSRSYPPLRASLLMPFGFRSDSALEQTKAIDNLSKYLYGAVHERFSILYSRGEIISTARCILHATVISSNRHRTPNCFLSTASITLGRMRTWSSFPFVESSLA